MNFGQQLKKIRRKLRDPDGNIWSRALLLNLFNEIQRDIEKKTHFLKDVQVIRIPDFYHCSYMYDWEWPYLPSGSRYYKALNYYQQGDYVYCYRFEGQIDGIGDESDEGAHFTQPWEAFAGLTPGEPVTFRFPANFHTADFIAYDRVPIYYTTKKQITLHDPSYIVREGTPIAYYREDDVDNSFVLYPRPSTIVWNDVDEQVSDPVVVYSHDWEEEYAVGESAKFTIEDEDAGTDHVFTWETGTFSGQDISRGMWQFETSLVPGGMVNYVAGDTTTSTGTWVDATGSIFNQSSGVVVDVIDPDDNILVIYSAIPTDIVTDQDISDYPEFLLKYIEYGVLEQAFKCNNDGYIPSLSQYYGYRYNIGIEAIKKFMRNRKVDRDYRLTTQSVRSVRERRLPKLPSTYPAI